MIPELDHPFQESPYVARDAEIQTLLRQLNRYDVIRCIGEGGMGCVYQAYDPVLRRDIALKVLHSQVSPEERRRFRREAIVGARFCHPSIARIFDMGVIAGEEEREWFAMEYLPGSDMERIIDRARGRQWALPLLSIIDVLRQVLAALQYAHDCKIVHRDVKPANIFVTRDPNTRFITTKLLDFGIALDLDATQTSEQMCGDPFYMAPEQTLPGAKIDARADIYSAGMSFYEIVTGLHPFGSLRDAPIHELFVAQREYIPPPPSTYLPSSLSPRLTYGLDMIFQQACAKQPKDRFQSARDMQEALLLFIDPRGV